MKYCIDLEGFVHSYADMPDQCREDDQLELAWYETVDIRNWGAVKFPCHFRHFYWTWRRAK
jgi:hypothetical protein